MNVADPWTNDPRSRAARAQEKLDALVARSLLGGGSVISRQLQEVTRDAHVVQMTFAKLHERLCVFEADLFARPIRKPKAGDDVEFDAKQFLSAERPR